MIDQRKLPARVEWVVCKTIRVDQGHPGHGDPGAPAIAWPRPWACYGSEPSERTLTMPLSADSKRWQAGCESQTHCRESAVAVERMILLVNGWRAGIRKKSG